MTDIGWGWLSDLEGYGRPGDKATDYQAISYTEGLAVKDYMHAAHGMIIARDPAITFDLYARKAAILMQMRFDGTLGFPGGLVDQEGESPIDSLNRELEEEIGLDLEKYRFTQEDHVISHKNTAKTLICHFFAKEVSMEDFVKIERRVLEAFEYGRETLGPVRVPLFTMGDGFRGFPIFLSNQFAGNARQQLLLAVRKFNLFTHEELENVIKAYTEYSEKH